MKNRPETGVLQEVLALAADALPAAGVNCLLVGGFAVNHYGYTRNTLDVDLMIASDQIDIVRPIMTRAGFTNQSLLENVAFFARPEAALRVDFLRVDRKTMAELLAGAKRISLHGQALLVPSLRDLIAMKLFALAQALARRVDKDLPDIAYLTILNGLDIDRDLLPLCERYANGEILAMVRAKVESLKS
jgi:hypothetical protein